ncbi:aminoglycoside phosphotransferase family protein [Nocardiopsis dassonvillei]|uniref:aminoglycoside phosphotransferase family protein n=1 Tax=Nocardiopsis dassonvillei TaxID=2014 RepID=UPI0033DBBA6E
MGENAVWKLLGHGLIARVARSADRYAMADRGVALARWMHDHQVPVALPADLPNPVIAPDGRPVTFWCEVPDPRPATPAELGRALRALHQMPLPDPGVLELPAVATVDKVDRRLTEVDLDEDDRRFLQKMSIELNAAYTELVYDLDAGFVHGDAHAANLLASPDGQLGWVDLDGVALGQPEWDLVLTAIEHDCGWVTPEAYTAFVDAYGYDITTSPAYPVLRQIRLLRMTSWLAQLPGKRARQEVSRRIGDLRAGGPLVGWSAF